MSTNDTENIYASEYSSNSNPIPATRVGYDNTDSGLTATNVQGAIDELAGEIPSSFDADEIIYDNTTSGLTATNVQGAIDELAGEIPSSFDADEIIYDNTTSGLTADDVQEAIDEVNGKFSNISQFPTLPSDAVDGTYQLSAVKADGVVTYSWTIVV